MPEFVRRDIHGVTVEVVCDGGDLADLVGRRLAAFPAVCGGADVRIEMRAGARPGNGRPADARVVHQTWRGDIAYSDELDTLWIDYDGAAAWCEPGRGTAAIVYDRTRAGWEWTATRPLLTLTLIELLKRRSLFAVHAAAAARGDAAVLFAAPSGAGKTTAALALLFAGWRLLGDDMLFLRDDGSVLRALAFPDEIDASAETISGFPELSPVSRWPTLVGYPKHQLALQELRKDAVALAAEPTLILVPEVTGEADHRLAPLGRGSLLRELLPNVVFTELALAQAHLDLLARLAETVPARRLLLGRDPAQLDAVVSAALADLA